MLILELENQWKNISELKELMGKTILIQNKTRGNIFIFPQDSDLTPPTKHSGVFIKPLDNLSISVYTENFFILGTGQVIILPLGNDLLTNTLDLLNEKLDEIIEAEKVDEVKWTSVNW